MDVGTVWIAGYTLTSVVSAALAWFYWRLDEHGTNALVVTMAGIALGTPLYVSSLVTDSLATKLLFFRLFSIGLNAAILGWLAFIVVWTGRDRLQRPRIAAVLSTPWVAFVLALWTNDTPVSQGLHHLVWTDFTVTQVGGLGVLEFTPNVLLLAYIAVTAVALVGSLVLLVEFVLRPEQRLYRGRNALLVTGSTLGIAVPFVVLALDVPFNATPFTNLVSSAFAAVAFSRFGVFTTAPVTRETLVDELDTGILVLDLDGRVVDADTVTRAVLDTATDPVGHSVTGVVADTPVLETPPDDDVSGLLEWLDGQELATTVDGDRHDYAVVTSTLNRNGTRVGYGVQFSDITEQRRQREELDALKELLGRVLRHNLRNDLTAIQSYAGIIATEADDRPARMAEEIIETSDSLVQTSEKARHIEAIVDEPTRRQTFELAGLLAGLVEDFADAHPDATFDTDLPERAPVTAHWGLDIALENLIENCIDHTDSGVHVTVSCTVDDAVTVTVSDDGPGIPDVELAVLDQGTETRLEHGSGVGLWLVDWVIDRSDASVSFDTDDTGTTVTLTLEPADGTLPGSTTALSR